MSKDALHIYAENRPAVKRNESVLNDLPEELHIIEANNKTPDNNKYPLVTVQATQNQKQKNTGGLAKLLKIKIGAKVMLTVNVMINDFLIDDQTGNIRHIKFAQGSAREVYF